MSQQKITHNPRELQALRKYLSALEYDIEYNYQLGHEFTPMQRYLKRKRFALKIAIVLLKLVGDR